MASLEIFRHPRVNPKVERRTSVNVLAGCLIYEQGVLLDYIVSTPTADRSLKWIWSKLYERRGVEADEAISNGVMSKPRRIGKII